MATAGSTPATEALPPDWQAVLAPVLAGPAMRQVDTRLAAEERAGTVVYPPRGQRLAALALTPPAAVKVVILGQDPYHGQGQANGLAFSVSPGVRVPRSLANIHKELAADLGIAPPVNGDLGAWARQGVLLLNSALTVAAGRAGSHQGIGWEALTDAALATVAAAREPSVFVLWGNHARARAERVPGLSGSRHLVLASAHPSPLSARHGFFGSRPFSRANVFLEAHGRAPVDWRL